eukprot:1707082-Pleurochrysis_carterae.AAC.1
MNEDEPLLETMLRKLHADHHRSIIADKDDQTFRNKLYYLSSAHSRSIGCEKYTFDRSFMCSYSIRPRLPSPCLKG